MTRGGAWLAFLAAVVAAGACSAVVLFNVVLSPTDSGEPPKPNGQAAAGEAPGEQPAAPTGDVTEPFRAFAVEGEPFPPEWLVRVQRVYWAGGGALWADAAMPRAPAERVRTIEQICLKLSEYVTDRQRLAWHGVSVRAVDGAELLTRTDPAGPCRPV